jgi:hypothetical protein
VIQITFSHIVSSQPRDRNDFGLRPMGKTLLATEEKSNEIHFLIVTGRHARVAGTFFP